MNDRLLITSDPDILSGTPVFAGTRVPATALVDYLEDGCSLEDFLEDFPTVSREHALAVLEQCKRMLVERPVESAA